MMALNLDVGDTKKLLDEERQLITEHLLLGTFSWRTCEEHLPALRGILTHKQLHALFLF
jgi:hypothetical protein